MKDVILLGIGFVAIGLALIASVAYGVLMAPKVRAFIVSIFTKIASKIEGK